MRDNQRCRNLRPTVFPSSHASAAGLVHVPSPHVTSGSRRCTWAEMPTSSQLFARGLIDYAVAAVRRWCSRRCNSRYRSGLRRIARPVRARHCHTRRWAGTWRRTRRRPPDCRRRTLRPLARCRRRTDPSERQSAGASVVVRRCCRRRSPHRARVTPSPQVSSERRSCRSHHSRHRQRCCRRRSLHQGSSRCHRRTSRRISAVGTSSHRRLRCCRRRNPHRAR